MLALSASRAGRLALRAPAPAPAAPRPPAPSARRAPRRAALLPRAVQAGANPPAGEPAPDAARLASALGASTSAAGALLAGPLRALAPALAALQPAVAAYNRALAAHPVRTKALTSFVGFALGDVLAQSLAVGLPFDPARFARLAAYGLLVDGPVGHFFYQFLDARVSPDDPRSNRAVLSKTAIDQLLWAPAMTVVFLAWLTLLEGRPGAVGAVVQAKVLPIMVANFGVWPLAHLINFKFVAPEQRILFNNVVAVAWTTYLSVACGAGSGHAGTARDALAAGAPCAAHAVALFAAPHAGESLRQAQAVDVMLHGWGSSGLPEGGAGAELLLHYVEIKAEIMRVACAPLFAGTP